MSDKKNLKKLAWIIILLLVWACWEQNETIVANADGQKITLEEFRLAYIEVLKQPDKFDSRELREAFLDELVQRKLLSAEASKKGYDQDEKLRYKIEAFKNKCLRDAHFEKKIKPQIILSDSLLREVYAYSREERDLQHLFFIDSISAFKAYELLNQGVPFEEIASQIFRDSTLANNSGDLGWVHWDQLEFDMAMAAFSLNTNKYSKPVRSTFGYHILRVKNFKKNPLLTEYDFQSHLFDTQKMVETRLGEKIAYEYIEKIMKNAEIKMDPKMLRFVGEILNRVLQRQPSASDQMRLVQLDMEEQKSLEDQAWSMRNEPIIYLDDEIMTVGEFIGNLSYIPYDKLKKSFKTTLDYVVRDAKLTQEAKDLGLSNNKKVILRTGIYEDYLLQFTRQAEIIRAVDVSESEIKNYYLKLVDGKNIPDNTFRNTYEQIKKQLITLKRSKAVSDYITELKKDIVVEKNIKPINTFYDQYKMPVKP